MDFDESEPLDAALFILRLGVLFTSVMPKRGGTRVVCLREELGVLLFRAELGGGSTNDTFRFSPSGNGT